MQHEGRSNQYVLDPTPTKKEVDLVRRGLTAFNREQTNGEYDQPGIEINLALKDGQGRVVGGISASTMLHIMYLELLWVAEELRGRGYGRDLVLAAERIGYEKGCITSQTWTLSFQAPRFYQKIGYQLLGIYDGYRYGITEYVLKKGLPPDALQPAGPHGKRPPEPFTITGDVTQEEMEVVHAGLRDYVDEQVGDKAKGVGVKLVVKDQADHVRGGLLGFTTMGSLVIEQLWVEEQHRGRGLGRKLLSEAERIAVENGCIGVQTYSLSFQSPGFFGRMGYEVFGVSDGFPDPVREVYLIKRLKLAFWQVH
jgi:GNAT superfamily N-acetyltransferase